VNRNEKEKRDGRHWPAEEIKGGGRSGRVSRQERAFKWERELVFAGGGGGYLRGGRRRDTIKKDIKSRAKGKKGFFGESFSLIKIKA